MIDLACAKGWDLQRLIVASFELHHFDFREVGNEKTKTCGGSRVTYAEAIRDLPSLNQLERSRDTLEAAPLGRTTRSALTFSRAGRALHKERSFTIDDGHGNFV